jgi:hypothetical protein
MKIIIPARLGSKGLPFKNRLLFSKTAELIPANKRKDTFVTTDDPEVAALAETYRFGVISRPEQLGEDQTSIRDVMVHAIESLAISSNELVTMLYLTYPQRTWKDVQDATTFFMKYYHLGVTQSLLCKKELKTHPFLSLMEHGVDGIFGKQLVQHDLYRRQDYPPCFEISHFISIFRAGAIYKLNKNLYNESTVFYPIRDTVDVDTQKELDQLNEQ